MAPGPDGSEDSIPSPLVGEPQPVQSAARRATATAVRFARTYPTVPLRRKIARGDAPWLRAVPGTLRRLLDLDGELVQPLRVEIGGGPEPTAGYVHVDADWRSRHLEHLSPAWELPFDNGSVDEILAVHVLEHIHGSAVNRTLREWRRVLRAGGTAQIHVPNAATVFPAFLEASPANKWELMVAIFGMPSHMSTPDNLRLDLHSHKAIYDFALLQDVILGAGFSRVDDVSEVVTDHHTKFWREHRLVERLSLVVRAVAGTPA